MYRTAKAGWKSKEHLGMVNARLLRMLMVLGINGPVNSCLHACRVVSKLHKDIIAVHYHTSVAFVCFTLKLIYKLGIARLQTLPFPWRSFAKHLRTDRMTAQIAHGRSDAHQTRSLYAYISIILQTRIHIRRATYEHPTQSG